MSSLLILDRDGVINKDSDEYIKSADEWQPIPGSIEAIATLSRSGYKIYVATNQSGLARQLFSPRQLAAMHEKMLNLVKRLGGSVEGIFYCPHQPGDHCQCRKPKPGLLLQISEHAHRSLSGVPVIGDSLRDLEAALAVDAKPILVLTGKGSNTLSKLKESKADMLGKIEVYDSLADAAAKLLGSAHNNRFGQPSC
jgi:D-glycero-D-manno-heptose 1,7-bisphosphate phosphatase